MAQYINKSTLIAEIERRIADNKKDIERASHKNLEDYFEGYEDALVLFKEKFLDTLEVTTDEENSLEKFKSLQHISRDLHRTLEDWGYAPNLYFFDGMWNVSWISCEDGDSIKDFEGNTPEEAINKAYDWFHSTFCNS